MLLHGGVTSSSEDDQDTEEDDVDDESRHDVRAVLASLQQTSGVIGTVSIVDSYNVTVATNVINVYNNQVAPEAPGSSTSSSTPTADSVRTHTLRTSQRNCSSRNNYNNDIRFDSSATWRHRAARLSFHLQAAVLRLGQQSRKLGENARPHKKAIAVAAFCLVTSAVSISIYMNTHKLNEPREQNIITPFITTTAATITAAKATTDTSPPSPAPVLPAVLGYSISPGENVSLLVGLERAGTARRWRPLMLGLCMVGDSEGCGVISISYLDQSRISWCACFTADGVGVTKVLTGDEWGCFCRPDYLQPEPLANTLRFDLHFGGEGSMEVRLLGQDKLVMKVLDERPRQRSFLRVAAESGSLCFASPDVTDGQRLVEGQRVSMGYRVPPEFQSPSSLFIGLCQPCGGNCSVLHLHHYSGVVQYEVLQSFTNSFLQYGEVVQEENTATFKLADADIINVIVIQRRTSEVMEVTFGASDASLLVPTLSGQNVLRLDSIVGEIVTKY